MHSKIKIYFIGPKFEAHLNNIKGKPLHLATRIIVVNATTETLIASTVVLTSTSFIYGSSNSLDF